MKSEMFYTDDYKSIQASIREFLNSQGEFLTARTARSPRAVGDAIQGILGESFDSLLGDRCREYSAEFARRSMADLAFKNKDGLYYVVDVKTHRSSTKFNMPNLTSVDRLARFYEDDSNYFVVLLIAYDLEGTRPIVSKVVFVPIEFLCWDCLTIGALGWGQIQIANARYVNVVPKYSRNKWMLELCDVVLEFYPREILKINERIERFQRLREAWLAKPDDV